MELPRRLLKGWFYEYGRIYYIHRLRAYYLYNMPCHYNFQTGN